MADSDLDVADLRSALDGIPVVAAARCDYCGGPLDLRHSVQYDVFRVVDVPALARIFDVGEMWMPDAARCPSCERDAIDPATEGFDEALVRVSLVETAGELAIDTSSLTVDDASLADDGYYPPAVAAELIADYDDLGIARWLRLAWFFETETVPDEAVAELRPILEASEEVPPGLS